MAPKNKARAAGVSASSFLDLKAELAKKEEQFAKDKAAGKSTSLAGGASRPDKVRLQLHSLDGHLIDLRAIETIGMGKGQQGC